MQKLPTHCELLQRNVRLQFLAEMRGRKATYETAHTLRPWSVVRSPCHPWQDVSVFRAFPGTATAHLYAVITHSGRKLIMKENLPTVHYSVERSPAVPGGNAGEKKL